MKPYDKYLVECLPCGGPAESVKPLSLSMVHECLKYARDTGEPLPKEFLVDLLREVRLLESGRPSELFKKQGQAVKDHPTAEILERDAVSYILTSQKNKSDPSPIKTICDGYGVTSSSVPRWKNKYKDTKDNINDAQIQTILEDWPALYQHFKKPKKTK